MVRLGLEYVTGRNINKDYHSAKRLYERAMSLGDDSAPYNLGILYENGLGVEKNYDTARGLFEKSANMRNPAAMCTVAAYYKKGLGNLPKDSSVADMWLTKAEDMHFDCSLIIGSHK